MRASSVSRAEPVGQGCCEAAGAAAAAAGGPSVDASRRPWPAFVVPITRDDAAALDADDPLARWRDEFVGDDPTLIYLDGNSLGRMPPRTIERMRTVMEQEWAVDLIRSWEHWIDLPQRVGDELARLIGALPGEVVVHDSTSINLYQLVHAACALRPDRSVMVVESGDFPSDRYVVDGIASAGISLTAEAGIGAISVKASALTGLAIELCDQFGLNTCTPRDPARRGGHVSVVHPEARSLVARLIERNVVPDFREPDIIRLGMSPLSTSFTDVYDGLSMLADLIQKS